MRSEQGKIQSRKGNVFIIYSDDVYTVDRLEPLRRKNQDQVGLDD